MDIYMAPGPPPPPPPPPPPVLTDDFRRQALVEMLARCAPSTGQSFLKSLRANGYRPDVSDLIKP